MTYKEENLIGHFINRNKLEEILPVHIQWIDAYSKCQLVCTLIVCNILLPLEASIDLEGLLEIITEGYIENEDTCLFSRKSQEVIHMAVDCTYITIFTLDSILSSCKVFQRQGSFIRGICIFSIEPEEAGIRTILKTKIVCVPVINIAFSDK